jgi:hypothetical protein
MIRYLITIQQTGDGQLTSNVSTLTKESTILERQLEADIDRVYDQLMTDRIPEGGSLTTWFPNK